MPGTKLSPELIKELKTAAKPLKKKQGTILFRAGDRGKGAFVVRRGRIKLTLEGGAGLYPSRTLGAGSIAGLPATVSGEPYSLTAEAIQDCELDFISRKELLALIQRNTKAALQILQILSEEIYNMRNTAQMAVRSVMTTVQ